MTVRIQLKYLVSLKFDHVFRNSCKLKEPVSPLLFVDII